MKAAIILLLVGLAAAQRPGGHRFTGGAPTVFGIGGGSATGFGGPGYNPCGHIERLFGKQRRDWGPKAWGLGLNNPCAIPPNPFLMERAIKLANQVPGTLVHVDTKGEIELTNQLGREAKVIDVWGRDLTDALEF